MIAKNYDCFVDGAYVFTNRRGMKKKSLVMPNEKEMIWTSKYGSLTLSQSGKGMPACGINEKGLVAEQASLPGSEYSYNTKNGIVSCLEAIQYLLDCCENVKDAVDRFGDFNISNQSGKLHYFLADKHGNVAIIEFRNGNMIVFQDENIFPLITNSRYEAACKNIPDNQSGYETDSFRRFQAAKAELQRVCVSSAEDAFRVLNIGKRNDTVWSIVYDLNCNVLWFRNKKQLIRNISLDTVDFSENAPSLLFDIDCETKDVCMEQYSRYLNRKNIEHFYNNSNALHALHLSDANFIISVMDEHIEQIEKEAV